MPQAAVNVTNFFNRARGSMDSKIAKYHRHACATILRISHEIASVKFIDLQVVHELWNIT